MSTENAVAIQNKMLTALIDAAAVTDPSLKARLTVAAVWQYMRLPDTCFGWVPRVNPGDAPPPLPEAAKAICVITTLGLGLTPGLGNVLWLGNKCYIDIYGKRVLASREPGFALLDRELRPMSPGEREMLGLRDGDGAVVLVQKFRKGADVITGVAYGIIDQSEFTSGKKPGLQTRKDTAMSLITRAERDFYNRYFPVDGLADMPENPREYADQLEPVNVTPAGAPRLSAVGVIDAGAAAERDELRAVAHERFHGFCADVCDAGGDPAAILNTTIAKLSAAGTVDELNDSGDVLEAWLAERTPPPPPAPPSGAKRGRKSNAEKAAAAAATHNPSAPPPAAPAPPPAATADVPGNDFKLGGDPGQADRVGGEFVDEFAQAEAAAIDAALADPPPPPAPAPAPVAPPAPAKAAAVNVADLNPVFGAVDRNRPERIAAATRVFEQMQRIASGGGNAQAFLGHDPYARVHGNALAPELDAIADALERWQPGKPSVAERNVAAKSSPPPRGDDEAPPPGDEQAPGARAPAPPSRPAAAPPARPAVAAAPPPPGANGAARPAAYTMLDRALNMPDMTDAVRTRISELKTRVLAGDDHLRLPKALREGKAGNLRDLDELVRDRPLAVVK